MPTKVHIFKSMVFPVVMYGCASLTIEKPECWRIDAFELWCWRRLLRAPWIARSNQSILKEINPENSLEGLTLKLKFQYLMWTGDSLERTLRAGKNWRQKENRVAEDEMVGWHHWLSGCEFRQTQGDGEEQGSLVCCSPWGHKELDPIWQLNNKRWDKTGFRSKYC